MTKDEDFFFYGNGRAGENPQDFIKKFESKDLKDTMSEDQKMTAFSNRLKSGNTAEEWYKDLLPGDKVDWLAVKKAFATRWPKKKSSSRSAHDKSNRLKDRVLKPEELGVWIEEDGRDELSHVLWADKALMLANDVPDPAGLLIPEVRHRLPVVLRECLALEYTTWEEFLKAVKAVSKTSLDNTMEKEKILRLALKESRAATAVAPRGTAPANNQQPPPFAFRTNDVRAADARANALPHHLNTPAGLALYATQIVTWNKSNPGRLKANEYCPYPLTPGTAALGSNKCFGCGHAGHRANDCPTPNSIPAHEHCHTLKHFQSSY